MCVLLLIAGVPVHQPRESANFQSRSLGILQNYQMQSAFSQTVSSYCISCIHSDHLSRKAGDVREFDSRYRNVGN